MSVDARVGVTEVLGDMAQVVDSGSHRGTCDGVTWVPLKGPFDGAEERLGERDAVRDGREAHVRSNCSHGRVVAGEEKVPEVLRVDDTDSGLRRGADCSSASQWGGLAGSVRRVKSEWSARKRQSGASSVPDCP